MKKRQKVFFLLGTSCNQSRMGPSLQLFKCCLAAVRHCQVFRFRLLNVSRQSRSAANSSFPQTLFSCRSVPGSLSAVIKCTSLCGCGSKGTLNDKHWNRTAAAVIALGDEIPSLHGCELTLKVAFLYTIVAVTIKRDRSVRGVYKNVFTQLFCPLSHH